jgi:hypothetical protein
MARAKTRKATPAEVAAYALTGPCYPLSHFVTLNGQELAVEDCGGWHKDDPKYEVMAPDGFHFRYDEVHTLLCDNLRDVVERVTGAELTPCSDDCR